MQTYTRAENVVLDYFKSSKDCCAFRLNDTRDINAQLKRFGTNKPMVYAHSKPSDIIIVERGSTYFAEVKSTENLKGITKSLFSQQVGSRERILRSGGEYYYFIYSLVKARWYKVPGSIIAENANRTWDELAVYVVRYLKGL